MAGKGSGQHVLIVCTNCTNCIVENCIVKYIVQIVQIVNCIVVYFKRLDDNVIVRMMSWRACPYSMYYYS